MPLFEAIFESEDVQQKEPNMEWGGDGREQPSLPRGPHFGGFEWGLATAQGWEEVVVPWQQRPQAPVVGLTLDKPGIRGKMAKVSSLESSSCTHYPWFRYWLGQSGNFGSFPHPRVC